MEVPFEDAKGFESINQIHVLDQSLAKLDVHIPRVRFSLVLTFYDELQAKRGNSAGYI